MTLKKTMLMGSLLAAAVVGGVGQAKADVLRLNVAPARVEYVRRAPGWRSAYPRHYDRRLAVMPGPRYARPLPVPVAPVYSYGFGDRQDPGVVAAELRAETERAADDLRFDVRQGSVEPRALASLEADRQEIERDLAEASGKGYITADDRAHLEQHVQEIRDLRARFGCAREGQVVYGG